MEKQECRNYETCGNALKPNLMDRGLCPKCRMIQDREDRIVDHMMRDPTKEPY